MPGMGGTRDEGRAAREGTREVERLKVASSSLSCPLSRSRSSCMPHTFPHSAVEHTGHSEQQTAGSKKRAHRGEHTASSEQHAVQGRQHAARAHRRHTTDSRHQAAGSTEAYSTKESTKHTRRRHTATRHRQTRTGAHVKTRPHAAVSSADAALSRRQGALGIHFTTQQAAGSTHEACRRHSAHDSSHKTQQQPTTQHTAHGTRTESTKHKAHRTARSRQHTDSIHPAAGSK